MSRADAPEPKQRVTPKKQRARAGAEPSQRQLRVAEEVRHLLSAIFLRGEFRNPALEEAKVTVTEVRISPDLKNATAFVTRLGRSDVALLLPALKLVAPYLRGELAKGLRLRVAPHVSFQPDTALEYAMHVNALLQAPEVARDLSEAKAGAPPLGQAAPQAPDPNSV